MDKFKIGVIGVGHLGRLHVQNYRLIPDIELVGVFDIDHDRARQVATEFQTIAYENLEDLLDNIQAASIVVTTTSHFEIASACLKRGVHCLVEKPLTSSLAEADELIELARQAGLILQVGHIERFNPAILALKDFELKPMFIESHRLASFNPRGTDVAVVLDLMIHDIDIILHLVKNPVTKIDASGVAVVTDEVDIANARLGFENGCVANITSSRISQKKMRKMRLFQRNAYIGIDFLQKFSEIYQLVDATAAPARPDQFPIEFGQLNQAGLPKKIIYERRQIEAANALKLELESFIHSIRSGTRPEVSGEEGREALRVALAITDLIKSQMRQLIG
ncbi:MAG: Gfo/Idh/MocA family oxidoreductase [candidate division KSB1 bacterium]|nr:Gfo/Idh/MocA family oxidoreductase [candidate division KSB1 bacterium]MDZ7334472.1 Gfo/Idh/MocA family oxidoreductase [candidate division KSB1 bacterium]MDZ7355999.1 Gfo/Idh/MocA family oxidoreductase [candidate division KSB1 bacterium]MDZ7376923.1 Gfo/Idh/MocA family oxidoreductase [candidate division KSB1 bacterium]MDZ7400667.1 Gfo/Idh/MocA family oxidoreductase [candidate division KSB1 bacterium]